MGRKYQQLSLENRCEIARLQADGCSIRQIAAALDRAPSTISREVKRNRGRHIGCAPTTTPHESALTSKRRQRCSTDYCTSNVNPPPRFRGDERKVWLRLLWTKPSRICGSRIPT